MDKLKSVWNKIKAFALGRKKRFYIILIVISSLVLLLDLSVRLLVPNGSMMSGRMNQVTFDDSVLSDTDGSDDTTDASDSDGSIDSDGSSDMTTPDSGTFASGDASQQGGGSMPDMSSGFTGGSTSEDSTSDGSTDSSVPDAGSSDETSGGLQGGSGSFASGDAQMPDMNGTDSGSDAAGGSLPDSASDGTQAAADASGDSADVTVDADDTSSFSGVSISMPIRILMGVRAAFWPILIIALLIDVLSIILLVLVSRRIRAEAQAAERERIAEAFAQDGEVHLVRPQQKKAKISPTTWILIIAAVIVLVLIVKVLSSATGTETSETEASVYEAAVESGDISTVLPGTGTLTEEDADEVSLPSEVEITKWYVSDGDTVAVGDVLAQIDTESALSAIASVQEVITSLDEELAELEDADTTSTVTAAAGGRVKAVYAAEDDDVIDTIYNSGSLVVLSLDGLMAVAFETESEVNVADEVTVTLSDGTEVDGTVESALNGAIVVTLTDEDTQIGDSVTVTDADGNELGSGELYVHSELQVLAFSGIVSSVSVSEEDEVDAGDTLLSLEDVDNSFETELLVEQRSVLEEQIQTLFRLYQDGYLYAETAGVVSGVSSTSDASGDSSTESDSTDNTEDTTESITSASGSSYYSGSIKLVSSSCTAGETNAGKTASAQKQTAALIRTSSDTDESESSSEDSSGSDDTAGSGSDDTDTDDSDENTAATESGYTNYIGIVSALSDSTATVTLYSLTGSTPSGGGSTSVDLSSTTVYVSSDGTLSEGSASDIAAGDTLILMCSTEDTDSDGLSPICVIAVPASAVEDTSDSDTSDSDTSDEDTSDDDTSDDDTTNESTSDEETSGTDTDDTTGGTDTQSGTDAQSDMQGSAGSDTMTDQSGTDAQNADGTDMTGSTDMTGTTNATGSTDLTGTDTASAAASAEEAVTETLTEEVTSTWSVAETTLLSITPQDYVYVTITVDELDILSLETGLEAAVTLDAFPGQSFTGVVESINTSGTNEGGNSKYTAVVRLDREEDMLAGMNASVKITLDTAENVLYVPAEAIVEDEDGTWVYTSYDEKTGTLGDPVAVETGVSDGTNVEIVSGLSQGDAYWYSVLDTVNYSTSTSTISRGLF